MALDLERYAIRYLERYPASSVRLRRALERWVARREPELDAREAIEQVLARLTSLRLLDDARFAASRARALRARGKSRRAIAVDLRRQGLSRELIDAALGEEGDLEAARRFVKRRRLGKERPENERAARRQRDLAALGRAGFDYETARRALDE